MTTQKMVLSLEQYRDLEEFLKDLVNSKRKMDIPSSDKTILRRVVSSLPTGIELLRSIWEEKGIPSDYYEELVKTLVANVEVDKSLREAAERGSILYALTVFVGIEEKLKADNLVFDKYLKQGILWWLSQNIKTME